MDQRKIRAGEVLAEAILVMIKEKQLFFLLIAFIAVISLILVWPLMDWYKVLLGNFPGNLEKALAEIEHMVDQDTSYILIVFFPSLFFSLGVMVLWSRACAGGTEGAFKGGLGALFRRVLWGLWRYIGAIFIIVLGMILITLPFGFMPSDSATALILGLVLYPVFMIFIFGVVFLLSVSLHAEARDCHLPISRAFAFLRGNFLRAVGTFLLVLLGASVVQTLVLVMVVGLISADSSIGMYLGFFILFLFSSFLNLLWVGFGAGYAKRLVPELKK